MDKPNLTDLIVKHGLNSHGKGIEGLLKEGIRLTGTPVSADRLAIGDSHLGGEPDLTDGFKWPVWKGSPMSFIIQIRLEDIAGFTPARDLPRSGMLSFFYDSAQETYGDDPGDRGGWAVYYFERAAQIKRTPFPEALPGAARFAPLALHFSSVWTLPGSLNQAAPDQPWTDQDQQNYEALLQDFTGSGAHSAPRHQMFGWPDQLQDDMQLQSALMSGGITRSSDPRGKQADQEKFDWQLLLQVDSDDGAKMRWASYGMLYYWIETQALKTRQFERSWLALQSD